MARDLRSQQEDNPIGREVSIERHLQDGDEFNLPIRRLIRYGKKLFEARFTIEEGAGRPLSKGTGAPLSDPNSPLIFPRSHNRISGPDANSCAGCHNIPISGGSGDISNNVFVAGQRFDFATFDPNDFTPTRGSMDERGRLVSLGSIANSRTTVDMFGSGYYEMLARQITADLQAIRDSVQTGYSAQLVSKGISFGLIARRMDGTWDTSKVEGLPDPSLITTGAAHPPSLLILPFHQSASTVSLRVFTNNAFNQHHGMQSTERFGRDTDPDGDGVANELTRADITAATIYQATLPVPTRVWPESQMLRRAAEHGERVFKQIGCASCHIPELPLTHKGWVFTEPGPYNPIQNSQPADTPVLAVDLNSPELPQPRLQARNGVVMVPIFTDFKLHFICKDKSPTDPNFEALNADDKAGTDGFFEGNGSFLTRRLWAVGSKPNFFHHGQYSTMKEAILAHYGEATDVRDKYAALSGYDQGSVIEFLKTLRIQTDER